MKIVMVSSESNPLVKTGGLADVVYSLSRELVKEDHEVFVFIPFYKSIKNKFKNAKYVGYFYVDMSWRHQYVGLFELEIDGIKFKLIDNEYYFNRDNLYGYGDDGERFAFYTLAVQKIIHEENIKPDIVHVHDWQGAMLPCLMKETPLDNYKSHFVLSIHNSAFKGYLPKFCLGDFYNLNDNLYDNGNVRLDGQVSTLKASIYYADKITTVSPTFRNELLSPGSNQGLNEVLKFREDDFVGILNGIDIVEFDSKRDKNIISNYDENDFGSNKKECKIDLLKIFNLANIDAPTYSLVTRLTWQKGIDLVLADARLLLEKGANLIVLGSGEQGLEQALERFRNKFSNQVGIYIGYSDSLAHKIYAGSDFLLMPSMFEPCGLSQMIAQRYGTLPIVRETGGLYDSVHAEVDGFSFANYNAESLYYVLVRTLEVYKDEVFMSKLIKTAMSLDRSWKDSMSRYINVYKESIKNELRTQKD